MDISINAVDTASWQIAPRRDRVICRKILLDWGEKITLPNAALCEEGVLRGFYFNFFRMRISSESGLIRLGRETISEKPRDR